MCLHTKIKRSRLEYNWSCAWEVVNFKYKLAEVIYLLYTDFIYFGTWKIIRLNLIAYFKVLTRYKV